VLSGHVHDYQRFSRAFDYRTITYLVIGNSGYHNLHLLAQGAHAGEPVVDGVTFEYGDASEYGFSDSPSSPARSPASTRACIPAPCPTVPTPPYTWQGHVRHSARVKHCDRGLDS
jgi:hypothetical protein